MQARQEVLFARRIVPSAKCAVFVDFLGLSMYFHVSFRVPGLDREVWEFV